MSQVKLDHPISVSFTDDTVIITLADGRTIGNPLAWHLWLIEASAEARAKVQLRHFSVYWVELDEGLDIEGMLRGTAHVEIMDVHTDHQL